MGAGDFLAGDEDAGDDLAFPVPPRRVVPDLRALFFDASSRDYPLDAKGFYVGLHEVDARVALAMVQFEGTIKCSPVGNRLRQIEFLDARTEAKVRYEVRRVLAPELAGGNVAVREVVVEKTNSSLAVLLRYVNLRLPENTGKKDPKVTTVRVNV
jgi:hypothetical protein